MLRKSDAAKLRVTAGEEDARVGDEQRAVRPGVDRGDATVYADACREVIGKHFHVARFKKSGQGERRPVCRGRRAGRFHTVFGGNRHTFAALRPFRNPRYNAVVGVRCVVDRVFDVAACQEQYRS